MPSKLFSALGGSGAAQTPSSGIDPGFMNGLRQFAGQFGPILNAQNPQAAVMNLLAQRGMSPEQIRQEINRYAAQATEIQKKLTGR